MKLAVWSSLPSCTKRMVPLLMSAWVNCPLVGMVSQTPPTRRCTAPLDGWLVSVKTVSLGGTTTDTSSPVSGVPWVSVRVTS
ncbi:hypothetical protein D9M68_906100 [compost metagenome]